MSPSPVDDPVTNILAKMPSPRKPVNFMLVRLHLYPFAGQTDTFPKIEPIAGTFGNHWEGPIAALTLSSLNLPKPDSSS